MLCQCCNWTFPLKYRVFSNGLFSVQSAVEVCVQMEACEVVFICSPVLPPPPPNLLPTPSTKVGWKVSAVHDHHLPSLLGLQGSNAANRILPLGSLQAATAVLTTIPAYSHYVREVLSCNGSMLVVDTWSMFARLTCESSQQTELISGRKSHERNNKSPESPAVTLTWHASKTQVQRHVLKRHLFKRKIIPLIYAVCSLHHVLF